MVDQNFKNHTRLVPMYHYVGGALLVLGFIGSIVNLLHADASALYASALLVVVFVILIIVFWYARVFALKAQDRAIRAEENFRHFILAGKPLDKELRMIQIIALRFASDEEMPALAQKAVAEKMTQPQIKATIKNWKTDINRV